LFFERFRADVRRYADGVHELGAPVEDPVLARLPAALRELYRSWDGMRLFTDSIVLEPAARIARADGRWRVGEAFGAPLEVDEAGRVYALDDARDPLLEGSTLERWLHAVVAREGLLVDRDGEWKDVFDGDALSLEVRRKRARAGLKADPQSAAWQLEAAELAFEEGELDDAEAALRAAVAADPRAGAAWVLLGGIERRAGRLAEAEQAFAQAAEATVDPERRVERFAEAARAAKLAGRDPARSAARAREGQAFVDAWLAQAEARLAAGDREGALNLAELVDAVSPSPQSAKLVASARARKSLLRVD
jgi:tetratricopeptide (TPR) repeat protein